LISLIEKRDELIAGYKKRIASFMVDVRISSFTSITDARETACPQ
jgi:hypothetical protein